MICSLTLARPLESSPAPTFDEVYESHFDFVWRSLRRLGIAPEGLDDAAQEVFIVVYQRLSDFEGRAKMTTWLFRIAINVARHHLRSQQRRPTEPLSKHALQEVGSHTPQDAVLHREELQLVDALLAKLPEEQRVAFIMCELEQMSPQEIADVLNIPLNTVYSRLRTARAQFVAHLRRHQARTQGAQIDG